MWTFVYNIMSCIVDVSGDLKIADNGREIGEEVKVKLESWA